MQVRRPEHTAIAELLASTHVDLLSEAECWFGGGTAIVMKYGEYRRSLDIDFLCSSTAGYRTVRNALARSGTKALFAGSVEAANDPRMDQYGVRLQLIYKQLAIKFEIIREARISVSGSLDPLLTVPILSTEDMFAEKLLANADRCMDRSVAYRDALDLGRLVECTGGVPAAALAKAIEAYGDDIHRKLLWVLERLKDRAELRQAADKLDMDPQAAGSAIESLREEASRLWPSAG